MSETFELGGDPDQILGSAAHWTNFGSTAQEAHSSICSLDSSSFVGSEGDTYRGRIDKDMTPHLSTTAEAWSDVGKALTTYAQKLREYQAEMKKLAAEAESQKGKVASSQTAVSAAQKKDLENANADTPDTSYVSGTNDAVKAHTAAVQAYNGLVSQAGAIREKHRSALDACCSTIDTAKHKRFQKPPGFWDKVGDFVGKSWDTFKKGLSWAAKNIAPILDVISMVAGVLALIPVLAPIMGPIALVAGGLSLGIKVLNKVINGEGSWLDIGVSAIGLIPGVKPLTTLGKASKLAKAANELGDASKALRVAQQGLRTASKGSRALRVAGKQANKIAKAQRAIAKASKAEQQASAAMKALTKKYDTIANAWKWTERGVTVGTALGSGAITYRDTGRLDAALVAGGTSLLGYKLHTDSKKFAAFQGIVSNGAQTAGQAYNMTVTDKWTDPKSVLKLLCSAGKTGISAGNATVFSSAGSHPDGTSRSAFETPNHWDTSAWNR